MRLVTWDNKLVDFLSGNNTILIETQEDYDWVINKMKDVGLDMSLIKKHHPRAPMLLEYTNNKGFTYWDDREKGKDIERAIKESTEWCGEEPIKTSTLRR